MVAYRLHLGARALAYGEKLIFQGPLPQKIELLADTGLLNLTYSQPIEVQRLDDKIFEVRAAENNRGSSCVGIRISSTPRLISNYIRGRSWLVRVRG